MAGARASMELLSKQKADKDLKFNVVGGRDDNTTKIPEAALKKTNQYGAFQDLGGHMFETMLKKYKH